MNVKQTILRTSAKWKKEPVCSCLSSTSSGDTWKLAFGQFQGWRVENNHSRTWPPTAHTRSQSSSTGPSAMSGNIWWVYVDQQRTRNALSKRSLTASRCLASVQETSMPSSPQPWVKDISWIIKFTIHHSPSMTSAIFIRLTTRQYLLVMFWMNPSGLLSRLRKAAQTDSFLFLL